MPDDIPYYLRQQQGFLSPDDVARFNSLGAASAQQKRLAEQLRMAQERKLPQGEYRTDLGRVLGSLVSGLGEQQKQKEVSGLASQLRGAEQQQTEGENALLGMTWRLPTADPAGLYSSDPTQQQAAAGQVTQARTAREELGRKYMASGNPRLVAYGQALLGEAGRLEGYGTEAGKVQLEEAGKVQDRATRAAETKSEADHRLVMEDLARKGLAAPETIVSDQGIYRVPKSGGPAVPVIGANGEVLKKPATAAQGAPGGGLTPEALDQQARYYLATGQFSQIGGGARGSSAKTAIANKAAEINKDQNIAVTRAGFGSDSKSLSHLQQQSDAVDAFEKTAMTNLHNFLDQAKGIVDTGSPLFNAPARTFMEKVGGDPKMAAINTARTVAIQEIGKVLSGATGGAALSDGARHEVESLLKPDASFAQIAAVADVLEKDMANRKAALTGTLNSIRSRIGGAPGGQPATAEPAAASTTEKVVNGKKYRVNARGKWEPAD